MWASTEYQMGGRYLKTGQDHDDCDEERGSIRIVKQQMHLQPQVVIVCRVVLIAAADSRYLVQPLSIV